MYIGRLVMTPDLGVNYVPKMMSFENSKIIVMLIIYQVDLHVILPLL